MLLTKFYHILLRSKAPTLDGLPVKFWWDDDGEDDEPRLRCTTDDVSVLIFSTDTITPNKNTYVVSIGATDYTFVV